MATDLKGTYSTSFVPFNPLMLLVNSCHMELNGCSMKSTTHFCFLSKRNNWRTKTFETRNLSCFSYQRV